MQQGIIEWVDKNGIGKSDLCLLYTILDLIFHIFKGYSSIYVFLLSSMFLPATSSSLSTPEPCQETVCSEMHQHLMDCHHKDPKLSGFFPT